MAGLHSLNISMLLFFCLVALIKGSQSLDEERKAYIVYLGSLVETDQLHSSHHLRMLQNVVDSRFVGRSLVRSYQRSFNGFVASLTPQEVDKLAKHEKVLSIFPSKTLYPQTTRSWDFMGFSENGQRNPTVESDIIIGVIDSGIWPESDSFSDKGFSPPPKKWKGSCKGGKNFTCNNKLIGARCYLPPPDDSARDQAGHGSHTASTAAGNYVKDASFYGIAKGTARGAVPSARIAAYRVCSRGCNTVDILAAFDDAIADGVDIITISISGEGQSPLKDDAIAIGALHASQKGILVVQSAGNYADKKTTTSTAPWVFSVAASSTDRGFVTSVALGNKTILTGKGINSINETNIPLLYGKGASTKCDEDSARDCAMGCLDTSLVMGKIVLCRNIQVNEAINARAAGAVAMQLELEENSGIDIARILPIAATYLKYPDFNLVEGYFNSTKQPMVNILTSGTVKNNDAPRVASFSSKGPNTIIPDIIKPDIAAPGIDILAAFSPLAPPSNDPNDRRSVKYSILSGTSMSCPHVAGAAAYVKSLHPDWSASAIKSALMTTAWKMDPKKDPLAEFSYGAGHLNPIKAVDPGLVYETSAEDYIKIFCSSGADFAKNIQGNVTCPSAAGVILPKDLNYPSMATRIKTNGNKLVTFSEKFIRTVTNVGPAGNPTYKVTTSKSTDYQITLKPETLSFGRVNEKKSFEVTVSGKTEQAMVSASLEWSDGVHTVRSPIVLYRDDF